MNRCVKCGSKGLRAVEVAETVTVGNLEFEGSVQGWSCDACGETYLAGPDVGSYEALVSRWLAEHGIGTREAFRFMRKSLGMRAVDLAGLLGVTPETVSHWETGKHELPRNAVALLAAMVIEQADGRTDTIDRLRQLGERPAESPGVAKPRIVRIQREAATG